MRPSPLVDALDDQHYGGKAASLARSLSAGLPVPPGFALGTTGVDAVFDGHAETVTQLRAEFAALAGPCAVRSSAIGEDSERGVGRDEYPVRAHDDSGVGLMSREDVLDGVTHRVQG